MPQIIKIEATQCDNELSVIASTSNGSSELFHIKSGFNDPVNYVVKPQSILPKGNYTLTALGINWGGPSGFKVTLTPSAGAPIILAGGSGLPAGGTWSQAVAITV